MRLFRFSLFCSVGKNRSGLPKDQVPGGTSGWDPTTKKRRNSAVEGSFFDFSSAL